MSSGGAPLSLSSPAAATVAAGTTASARARAIRRARSASRRAEASSGAAGALSIRHLRAAEEARGTSVPFSCRGPRSGAGLKSRPLRLQSFGLTLRARLSCASCASITPMPLTVIFTCRRVTTRSPSSTSAVSCSMYAGRAASRGRMPRSLVPSL